MNKLKRDKLAELCTALSQKHGFRPAILEKDYYLTLILKNINGITGDSVVFKGGTLFNKIHLNYHRMSEDLDFSYAFSDRLKTRASRSKAITPIREKIGGFLKELGFSTGEPTGTGFNNSTQYVFNVIYDSMFLGKSDKIKIEISLRAPVYDKPVLNEVKHLYRDIFTDEDLIPGGRILSLSYDEAVAEKLKAAITRLEPAIRDYYDLKHINEAGFDFCSGKFVAIFNKKLEEEKYLGDYAVNFGLNSERIILLKKQVETDLKPVIRAGEEFNLDEVLEIFNGILQRIKLFKQSD